MPGFGGLAVLAFAPYIADILGGKTGTGIGCLFIFMGALIQAFPYSRHPGPTFLSGGFFVGFGSNISNATCPLLITEISHPRHRGRVTTIYNTLWYLGAIIAAWTTCGTLVHMTVDLQWPLPTALQCLMSGIQLCVLYLIPGTPRWHISKGRDEEAKAIIIKYHGNNDQQDAFAKWKYTEIRETIHLEREFAINSRWYELVRTPSNRKRCALIILIAIFSQCSSNGLVSYYLSSIPKSIGITEYAHFPQLCKPLHELLRGSTLTLWQLA